MSTALERILPIEDEDDFWCIPCNSFHPVPQNAEHHRALMCFAHWPPVEGERGVALEDAVALR